MESVSAKHHPQCPCFEGKKRYARISLEGGGSYIEPMPALLAVVEGELSENDPGTKLTIEIIEMYEEEYNNLQEFTGH